MVNLLNRFIFIINTATAASVTNATKLPLTVSSTLDWMVEGHVTTIAHLNPGATPW
jgi:hypothetical protein